MVVFDDNEKQVPEIQQFTIVEILEEKLNSLGYTSIGSEFSMASFVDSKVAKSEDGMHLYLTQN
jgi:hypothetical protein